MMESRELPVTRAAVGTAAGAMRTRTLLAMALAATAIVSTVACSQAETTPEADEASGAQPAAGASIERLDPALDELIAPDAVIEKVATGFGFTEGPMWRDGKLWFSDVTGDKLRTVDRTGKVVEVLENSGGLENPPQGANIGSNGLVPAEDGRVLMAQMGARRIVSVDTQGNVEPFLSDYEGARLNSPNDMVYAPDGALWFTDPPFGLFNGMDDDPAKELKFNGVFRYAGGKLSPAITDLELPNGIGLSPDGKTLYVSDYANATIYAWNVGESGAVSGKRTLITLANRGEGGADGLKVDKLGNIWATGPGGISVVSAEGKLLGHINLPEVAANLAFGEDGQALWITGSTSIYRLPVNDIGVMPRFAR